MSKKTRTYKAIVIGVSSGGMRALKILLPLFSDEFDIPVIIVQHVGNSSESSWIEILNKMSNITIKEADEKEKILEKYAYVAPPNYHLLIEPNETFTLTIDERVNFARPSIDVLFETASETFGEHLVGIILTGANSDGAEGLKKIKNKGGITIVQDPKEAEAPFMPSAAIKAVEIDYILPLAEIAKLLNQLNKQNLYEINNKK